MIKKLFGAIIGIVFVTNACLAQPTGSQSVTNWGESVCDVQFSIGLTSNVVVAGSSLNLQCRIKNLSTNSISWAVIRVTQGFDAFLTNNLGKSYELLPRTHNMMPISYSMARIVQAGSIYECSISIPISKNIEPGDYEILAERDFETPDRKYHNVFSNFLKVQIK